MLSPVITILLTYTICIIVLPAEECLKTMVPSLCPMYSNVSFTSVECVSDHALGDCFSPYKIILSGLLQWEVPPVTPLDALAT